MRITQTMVPVFLTESDAAQWLQARGYRRARGKWYVADEALERDVRSFGICNQYRIHKYADGYGVQRRRTDPWTGARSTRMEWMTVYAVEDAQA